VLAGVAADRGGGHHARNEAGRPAVQWPVLRRGQPSIPENELFSSFGLESLTLAKIVAKINQDYVVALHPRDVLKHQTLRDASQFIYGEISQQQAQKAAAQ
jgi:hypothetical protein